MKTAIIRSSFVFTVVLLGYVASLLLIQLVFDADFTNVPALVWTGAFLEGVVFAFWNAIESGIDMRVAIRRRRPRRIIIGGQWTFRSNTTQGVCCLFMVVAGFSAIFGLASIEVRAVLFTIGGLSLAISQVWNNLDRQRIVVQPYVSEAMALGRLASELARLGRDMGHESAGKLALGVGALELMLTHEGISQDEAAILHSGLDALMSLGQDIKDTHQRIRSMDPSYRSDK